MEVREIPGKEINKSKSAPMNGKGVFRKVQVSSFQRTAPAEKGQKQSETTDQGGGQRAQVPQEPGPAQEGHLIPSDNKEGSCADVSHGMMIHIQTEESYVFEVERVEAQLPETRAEATGTRWSNSTSQS